MDAAQLSRRGLLAGLGGVPLAAAAGMPDGGRQERPQAPGGPPRPRGERRTTVLRGAELVLTMDPGIGRGELVDVDTARVVREAERAAAHVRGA